MTVASLEDKIVQRAVVEVLGAVYEVDFLGFSYGFRPGRGPHHALDALRVGIERKKVNWVLDADIREFFTNLDHRWLVKFLEHRIADRRVLRLIGKWLSAGVVEDGEWSKNEGAPQGHRSSPLLANVYLHYVFDLWVQWWRSRFARGDVIAVRFADDSVMGFEYQQDAQRFLADLRERFARFGLELHPDKTRLIEFGRHAAGHRRVRGDGKPETFDFLGFTHMCGVSRKGRFWCKRKTISKRMRAKLSEVNEELKRRRHQPIPEQGRWLRSVVAGHLAYYAVPGNIDAVAAFRTEVTRHWSNVLRRRSQRTRLTWPRMSRIVARWLPTARPCDASFPSAAARRQNPRQEPSAVIPHAGICAGGRPQGRSLPRKQEHTVVEDGPVGREDRGGDVYPRNLGLDDHRRREIRRPRRWRGELVEPADEVGLDRALQTEMTHHIGYESGDPEGRGSGNCGNGSSRKTVSTTTGPVVLTLPRDRNATFEPVIAPKRARRIGNINLVVLSGFGREIDSAAQFAG